MEHKDWQLLLFFSLILIILMLAFYAYTENKKGERDDFMTYCISQGNKPQVCDYEYKRMENGQQPTVLIMPMMIGR